MKEGKRMSKKAKKIKEAEAASSEIDTLPEEETNEIPEDANSTPEQAESESQPSTETERYTELLDRYQRSLAEFDNFRKRTIKEKAAQYDEGIRAVCEKLLGIIDNFERALKAVEDKDNSFYKGVEMIARQFENVLTDLGIEPIYIEPLAAFDHNIHHAVAHAENENSEGGGVVVAEVLQTGYIHKDKVLRPSMVKTTDK